MTDEAFKDPFEFPFKAPKGKAYQWLAVEVMGEPHQTTLDRIKNDGWKAVPFKRHTKILPATYNRKGKIFYSGAMLYECSKTDFEERLRRARKQAQDMYDQQAVAFGLADGRKSWREPYGSATPHPMASVMSEPYEVVPTDAKPILVDVSVQVRLPVRLQDAARALRMTDQAYANAMVVLYLRGDLGGLWLPIDGAFELHYELKVRSTL